MLFNWSHKKPINPLPLSLSSLLSFPILCLFHCQIAVNVCACVTEMWRRDVIVHICIVT